MGDTGLGRVEAERNWSCGDPKLSDFHWPKNRDREKRVARSWRLHEDQDSRRRRREGELFNFE